MFFNSDLLTKRGALAQVWMASHLSSKLSKSALTSTSIPKSVQSILGQELLPMALRLSGQLLLGIARIYSRKTKYLLDDAQETLHKVKKAFQNEGRAAVDLPEDHGAAGAEDGRAGGRDINLRREGGDLEDLLALEFADGEWNLEKHLAAAAAAKAKDKGKGKQKALTANIADITLDESFTHDNLFSNDNLYGNEFDLGFGDDDLGFDPDFALFEDDPELNALAGGNIAGPSGERSNRKKRSREDGDDGEGSVRSEGDLSVEMGRDAAPHASSERGVSIGPGGPFDLSFGAEKDGLDGMGDVNMDFGGGGEDYGGGFDGGDVGLDFGLEGGFGGGFDEPLPGGDREKTPNAPSINGDDTTSLQLTPRAAADVAARTAANKKAAEDKDKGEPVKKRQKHVTVDKVIELDWEAGRLEGKERFKDPQFLPSSRLHLALLAAPSTANLPRLLPKESKTAPAFELFAPRGLLAPELQDLFKMPTRREQIKLEGRSRNKDAERDVEVGRRAMSVVSNMSNHLDPFAADAGDLNQDFGGGFDGFDLGAGEAGEDYGGGFEQQDFELDLGLDGLPGPAVEGAEGAEGSEVFKTPSKRAKKQKTSHEGREGSIFSVLGEDLATPARSVLSALARDDLPQYRSDGPLAVFDDVSSGVAASIAGTSTPSQSQSQSQQATLSQSLGTTEEGDAAETATQNTGTISLRSKNTRKAVRVLKGEIYGEGKAEEIQEEPREEKAMEFGKVAEKASRRAAASFFFELLVLSSADVVKLKQPTAYGEIEVKGTDKLREMMV
ncbi:hypothetical protein JCM11641_008232 [Rhodosporidiobolus odoratus]